MKKIVLIGMPNTGKSTLLNRLTGAHAKVGNWPGLTVSLLSARLLVGDQMAQLIDLPGIYGLSARSLDERIAVEAIAGQRGDEKAPDALLVLIDLVAATSFAIMVGLQWSLRTKGTIGSVMAAIGVLGVIGLVLGVCAAALGNSIPYVGAAAAAASPLNMLFATVDPSAWIGESMKSDVGAARTSLAIGTIVASVVFGAACFGMHAAMKRSFMMTVRRLAGTN
jgi:ferrous iron transport protein B